MATTTLSTQLSSATTIIQDHNPKFRLAITNHSTRNQQIQAVCTSISVQGAAASSQNTTNKSTRRPRLNYSKKTTSSNQKAKVVGNKLLGKGVDGTQKAPTLVRK